MKKYIHSLLFSLLLIASCQPDDETITGNPGPSTPDEYVVPTIIPKGDEQYLSKDSDYIFDQESLHTFELKLPASALAELDNDPAAEEYVEGTLIFQGDTISPVGIRYKGSVGAFVNCLSGTDWANPSGHKLCTKLSMKVKINWKERQEKFYKLKKLQFHSMNLDDSQMRERLGYWLFRQMGVPAPRSVHARLIVNGEYMGIHALTEQIDGRMMRYNFDDGTGNLYKEIWPLKMNGQPFTNQQYLNKLETNTDENPTADLIRTFAQEVAAASDDDLKTVIDKWMDVDGIISYAMVDRMIRHDDGPFHWYCGGGSCSSHNFYWYEEPTGQTLHLIPWDLDNAFENIISNINPVTPIKDKWGETSNNCNPFNYGAFQLSQWSAACDKLTGGWVSYEEEYNDLKQQFKDGPFSAAEVNTRLQEWENQIRDATKEASDAHNDAVTLSQWSSSMQALRSQVNFARNQ